MEFHISRQVRDFYEFGDALFSLNGNVIFADFHAVRVFTQKMNRKRDLVHFPENSIQSSQINAMGLIDEILHYVIKLYRDEMGPDTMKEALHSIQDAVGKNQVEATFLRFVTDFPPLKVYRKEITPSDYLNENTDGRSNLEIALEEMVMLWIANKNPAHIPYLELFDHRDLIFNTEYRQIIKSLHDFFEKKPPFGPDRQNLIDMLRNPAIQHPHSLFDQLEYIRTRWADLLGNYILRLLNSLDLIQEERKRVSIGAGPIEVPVYRMGHEEEQERFSLDSEWMPRLVLIAKNAFVWLDQLSKKYQRAIKTLDQIPEQELDSLARWGFKGLWLIGLWERSAASARIKQYCGNPEAIASAYSLTDYQIAESLGGEKAYEVLREICWKRGIRLASDMVPNHMAIDSNWVMNHPEWFVHLEYSPFPAYNFDGPDLSQNKNASIYIEDHYYDRTDAAVVFKWTSRNTGDTRYIYHGNDGTSMPWNDTAQLNYLLPEVREAVIHTILQVAKKFPIIRFDAAMTLTKRHYQRLWYPEPGHGGDIPSRAGFGMTKEKFNQLMPEEFWREVVDRVSREAPDTLLLAEAFWLMEGYFVRTLGMHRVYNSAFMNLLRDEDNAKYRQIMKNTLEFEPEIMKRFVNFMNNPDESTAVEQFGKGDKYFGICLMMVTLPGLPMFGHGQVEGFSEKYGMEYQRAYWEETVDPHLVNRHEREIFPILHQRTLFAGVENFLLYDFFTSDGNVDENVYAYSNLLDNRKALVLYNNIFGDTAGWVRTSVGFSIKDGTKGQVSIGQKMLAEGLDIQAPDEHFLMYRDQMSGLEFIQPVESIRRQGLYFELGAYQSRLLLDFREVADDEAHSYQAICQYLNGRGVPSIQEALLGLIQQRMLSPFKEIVNQGYLQYLLGFTKNMNEREIPEEVYSEARQKMKSFLAGVAAITGKEKYFEEILDETETKLRILFSILTESDPVIGLLSGKSNHPFPPIRELLQDNPKYWLLLFGWIFTHPIGKLSSMDNYDYLSQSWFKEWNLAKTFTSVFEGMGLSAVEASILTNQIDFSCGLHRWFSTNKTRSEAMNNWLADSFVWESLKINRYKDILWFHKESYEEFILWMHSLAYIQILYENGGNTQKNLLDSTRLLESLDLFQQSAHESGYQIERLLQILAQSELQDANKL